MKAQLLPNRFSTILIEVETLGGFTPNDGKSETFFDHCRYYISIAHKISKEPIEKPAFRKLTGTRGFTIGKLVPWNCNRMLSEDRDGN